MEKILYIVLIASCFLFIGDVSAISLDNIYLLTGEESVHLTCSNPSVLKIIYLVKLGINLIQIIAPIILIIMLMMDGIKSITSEDGMDKKFIGKSSKKLLAAVIIFVIPAIINLVLSRLGEAGYNKVDCWNEATKEGVASAEALRDDEIEGQEKEQKYGENTSGDNIEDTICVYTYSSGTKKEYTLDTITVKPSGSGISVSSSGSSSTQIDNKLKKLHFYDDDIFDCATKVYACHENQTGNKPLNSQGIYATAIIYGTSGEKPLLCSNKIEYKLNN